MTTKARAAGMGAAAEDSRDNDAKGKKYCDSNEPLQDAIGLLREAIQVTDDSTVRVVLEDCIKLITDVCLMSHGFGAALKAKIGSR